MTAPWEHRHPEGWRIAPLSTVVRETRSRNKGLIEKNLLSLSYGRIVRRDIGSADGLVPASYETYQIVEPGQVVLRMTDLQNDMRSLRSGAVAERGIITSAYIAIEPVGVTPAYLAWLLRGYDHMKVFYSFGGGVRQSLTFADLKRLPTVLPPEGTQRHIADYLDRETATIDALIEKQNALLLLLRERRSQLPTRVLSEVAGTRMQLRHVVADITDCPHWTPEQADSFDYAAVRSGSIRNGMYRHSASVPVDRETFIARHGAKVVPGNVLFAREAPAGEACLVPDDFQLCLGQRTVLIECDSKKLLPELVVANIYTRGVQDYFANASFGSTVANVRLPVLRATRVVVPPLNEQREIADHLDRETAKIDALIAKAERFIELAQERRAALITAAVTGQIEIPTEG